MRTPGRGYSRLTPDARKANLVDATLQCLKEHGFQGMSVRKICAVAGVSPGLINHHYSGKDELVAEAYRTITQRVMAQLRDAMARSEHQDARAQLSAFFNASFSEELLNPELLEAWLAFWGAVKTAEAINRSHTASYHEYHSILSQALALLATEQSWPDFDEDLAAIGLTALLDGLWLEQGLNPEAFSAEEGVLVCEAWVDGLVAGAYRRFCGVRQQS